MYACPSINETFSRLQLFSFKEKIVQDKDKINTPACRGAAGRTTWTRMRCPVRSTDGRLSKRMLFYLLMKHPEKKPETLNTLSHLLATLKGPFVLTELCFGLEDEHELQFSLILYMHMMLRITNPSDV